MSFREELRVFSARKHEGSIKVVLFKNRDEYTYYFQESLKGRKAPIKELESYLEKQLSKLDLLIQAISPETFWEVFPILLGIDSKLILLSELIQLEDISQIEIIRLVESDYQTYFKELCGYDLTMKTGHSMVFNIV